MGMRLSEPSGTENLAWRSVSETTDGLEFDAGFEASSGFVAGRSPKKEHDDAYSRKPVHPAWLLQRAGAAGAA